MSNWLNFFKSIWPSFCKSIQWTFFTIFCGLVQILFVLVISLIVKDKPFFMDYFFNNCTLLFFSTAVVSSVTFDFHINNKRSNVYLNSFFPLLIISICSIVFTCYYLHMEKNPSCKGDCLNVKAIHLENGQELQYVIFFLSIIFTIGCKTVEYYNIKKK